MFNILIYINKNVTLQIFYPTYKCHLNITLSKIVDDKKIIRISQIRRLKIDFKNKISKNLFWTK